MKTSLCSSGVGVLCLGVLVPWSHPRSCLFW